MESRHIITGKYVSKMKMQLLDWLIVIVPILALIVKALYPKKDVRGIIDYLAAGRVAERCVLSVGELTEALSVIPLAAGRNT